MATKRRQKTPTSTPRRKKRAPAIPGPVLSLATLVERRTIKIDDKLYDLKHPGELGLVDHQRIGTQASLLSGLQARGEEVSEGEAALLSGALDSCCRLILEAPDEIHARLNDFHRMGILNAFTQLQSELIEVGGGLDGAVGSEPPKSTGASSSQS